MSSGKNMYVLVVDEDPVIKHIHSMNLKKAGLETRVAKMAKKLWICTVLELASFHLVLMDMEMTGMDGPTATRELGGMGVDSMIVGISLQDRDPEKSEFMAVGLASNSLKVTGLYLWNL